MNVRTGELQPFAEMTVLGPRSGSCGKKAAVSTQGMRGGTRSAAIAISSREGNRDGY